jgi:hypothetical protein
MISNFAHKNINQRFAAGSYFCARVVSAPIMPGLMPKITTAITLEITPENTPEITLD